MDSDKYATQNESAIINCFSVEKAALVEEIKRLKRRCAKLEKERSHYMNESSYYDLFNKYIGLYNEEDNTLIVHHFIDNDHVFPYGCGNFDADYACYSVKGSWDSWTTEYKLEKKPVKGSDGIYEGCVYYIVLDNIIAGNEYEFKFQDSEGYWVEPVLVGETAEDAGCQVKVKENNSGSWNAVLTVRNLNE